MSNQQAVLLALIATIVVTVLAEGVPDARRVLAIALLFLVLAFLADAGVDAVKPFAFLMVLAYLYGNWRKVFGNLGVATGKGK